MIYKLNLIILITMVSNSIFSQSFKFPFGQELKNVSQKDTSPKKVFVLGVYASAVHAKWLDNDGKIRIKALAVASEPCIFWTGNPNEAKIIISEINIPQQYGKLIPADSTFNGPSGRSLDENYLSPLHFTRDDAWLCDLVPYSCKNSGQDSALKREYDKFLDLPKYSIPEVPKILATSERINVILNELKKSQADTIILLGDQPIKYFLSLYDNKFKRLSDFIEYGKPFTIKIENKPYIVYALAHPRQTSKLGASSKKWFDLHKKWKLDNLKNNYQNIYNN